MKVLVIGANGFLGRNLVKRCLTTSWNVTCVYHNNYDYLPNGCKKYSYDELKTINTSFDVIFLLAASIPYKHFNHPSVELLQSNILLSLETVKKFSNSKLIFSSSASVYGNHDEVISEASGYNNPNFYGLTKLAGETIVRFHKNYQIIRFSSLYGTGMNPSTFLPTIINDAKFKKIITIHGRGMRYQDYLHVDDAVSYLLSAASCNISGIYLGVNGISHSNIEVAECIKEYIKDCLIQNVGNDDSPSFRYNNDITKNILKFTPKISLEKGIAEFFYL